MSFFNDLDKIWGQESEPPPKRPRGISRRMVRRRWLIIIGGVVLFFIAITIWKGIYTEWLWFRSLGFSSVYTTILTTKVWLFFAGTLIFLALLISNLMLARRLSPISGGNIFIRQGLVVVRRVVDVGILIVAIFLSIIFGLVTSEQWEMVLRFSNATNFGVAEPLLTRDVAFYVFNLPFYHFLQGWLTAAMVITLILTVAIYGLNLGFRRTAFTTAIKGHLSVLGATIFFLIGWSYRLNIFDLVYSRRGVIFGAGYTDVHAQWLALKILIVISIICGILLLISVFRRWKYSLLIPIGLWVVSAIIFGSIYPALVQRFQVEPSELSRERPYIEHNIGMTRLAFGLDKIEEIDVPVELAPSEQDIARNSATMNNIRLWDYRPLKDTYNQIQSIRLYYNFVNIDVDRYTVDGSYRQVLLGARELAPEALAAQAQTWVTRRLQFTHGYGAALTPVNEVSEEGLPNLWVKDVPPVGKIKIERPEIYYGERTDDYVIVGTKEKEFDYPKGDTNVYTKYAGESGIRLDSFIRKLAFAWELGDINILISRELTPESRLLYRRNIQQRVQHIAPFLKLDHDPYIVIDEGKLFWVQDAYTVSGRYPYSQPTVEGINYIRNSVKIVTSAYDGSITFYLVDPEDALVNTYAAIFPGLFTPIGEMPPSLREHLRYPQDLFQIQVSMYQAYHMTDPRVFYNKEDLWTIPIETYADSEQPMEPYYIIMRLPGEEREEFLLMLPFTPTQKDNMITWLAARSDGDKYGKLIAYNFPKDKLIYGPRQIEARIDQDPTISGQFTLWGQKGSQIIRGNLMVIPIENSILYVEPVYLQAERGRLPELKRVIVASGERIVMEPTLAQSLSAIYAGLAEEAKVTIPSPPAEVPLPTEIAELAKLVQEHYNKAQEYLKAGDWAGWGEELKKMEEALNQLVELATK
ncbi:MAG: UPF0182 family protein [Dehalococcoidales bacterium]|nr:UPF0182 family protein [Dehalococcoidales bacterium]